MRVLLQYAKLSLSVCILFGWLAASGQTRTIRGKITSATDHSPLSGVTVRVKGTNTGVITDDKGRFTIHNAAAGSTLVFSSVGFTTVEQPVTGKTTMDVELKENATSLNGLVVIGYGSQKKKDLTGSIQTISASDITRSNPVNPYQALQGQAAGVDIIKTSNLPGKSFSLNVRGLGSINYNTQPLVVIDGIMGGDLNSLNPSDIQSMEVLKDASALAIYGSRGANGVIIVTTKKGAEGKPQFGYHSYVTLRVPSHLPRMMNAKQFYKANTTDRELSGGSAEQFTSTEDSLVKAGGSTDWPDLITRPVVQTSQVISVSGGSKNTSYYGSGGFLTEPGLTIGEDYKRYNVNVNVDSRLTDFLKVGFTSNYAYSIQNEGSFESLRSAYRARPTGVPYFNELVNPSESSDVNFKGYAVWMGINDHQVMNPVVESYPGNQLQEITGTSFLGNAYVELAPVKGLTLKSSLSTSLFDTRTGNYRGTFTKSGAGTKLPTATYNTDALTSYTWDNILTYDLTSGKHHFTFTGLQSAFMQKEETYAISVKDLPYASDWYNLGSAGTINSVGSDLTKRTILSYMGRLNYSFNDELLITLTGRWDGSSVLAAGHQWAFFPSAALAWRLSQEPFISNLNTFSNLKLRLSYGEVGNDVVAPYSTQANLMSTFYAFGGSSQVVQAPAQIGNAALGWEKSKEINLGLDLGLVKGRINATIDVYNRRSEDLILNEKIPISTGFSNVTTNLGEVQNKGIEVSLSTVNIQSPHLSWMTTFNFTSNHNEIVSLYGGAKEDLGNKLFVGKPLKANYDYKFDGIWQTGEADKASSYGVKPGSVKVVDKDNNGSINSTDKMYLGTELPKWLLGIQSNLKYKNWDFSFSVYTRQGVQYENKMINGTFGQIEKGRYNALVLDYWTPKNPSNSYYGLEAPQPWKSAIYYQDATYWRVGDITLGYDLPKKLQDRWGLDQFRIYGQVTNPFIFTSFINFDPESNSSTYIDDVPSTGYTIGVDLSF